ncbi:unnamed protein product [Periconia digitata]|uniref:Uncharacterized protein n=1 Tax=Periconia digitata TaxID=1303443 RepID=A0A9W4U950_9PLEO|nr:unnamed protein product [Periconia digitata]
MKRIQVAFLRSQPAVKSVRMSGTMSYAAAAGATKFSRPTANSTDKQQQQQSAPSQPPNHALQSQLDPNRGAERTHHPSHTTPPPNPYHTPRTSSPEANVYVLTLRTTSSISEPLAALRNTYFPAHLNKIPAHITLFHALPASRYAVFDATISALARNVRPYAISTGRPRRMRKGILVLLAEGNKQTRGLRADLLENFLQDEIHESESSSQEGQENSSESGEEVQGWLSEQDRKPTSAWTPHWTIMNKVDDGDKVQEALATVTGSLHNAPERGTAEGLVLWKYLVGGRWEEVKEYRFGRGI